MNFVDKVRQIWYDGILDTVLTKLFGLPKPYALPMRGIGRSGENEYTWEDWREENQKNHPVRYFLSETVPHLWKVYVIMRIEHMWYWFRSHTYNRYHLLSLRQPYTDTDDDYDWGWIDENRQIVFACFNVLVAYVNCSNNNKYSYGTSDEDIKKLQDRADKYPDEKEGLERQIAFLKEAKALYDYWTIYRKDRFREKSRLLRDWHDNKANDPSEEKWKALRALEDDIDKEEDEMLIRLMKIRRHMWT